MSRLEKSSLRLHLSWIGPTWISGNLSCKLQAIFDPRLFKKKLKKLRLLRSLINASFTPIFHSYSKREVLVRWFDYLPSLYILKEDPANISQLYRDFRESQSKSNLR
jgi:hypothetical protein